MKNLPIYNDAKNEAYCWPIFLKPGRNNIIIGDLYEKKSEFFQFQLISGPRTGEIPIIDKDDQDDK